MPIFWHFKRMGKTKKFTIEEAKNLSPKLLLFLVNSAKNYLKDDEVMRHMCEENGVDVDFIDQIPITFGELDVSARTDHGVITLSYNLLCDGDFYKDFSYIVHECQHYFQQCFGTKPTKGSNDGDYLDNKFEQEAFKSQVEFMANEYGKHEAEDYVDHLLEHHDIINKKEKETKKDILMARVD